MNSLYKNNEKSDNNEKAGKKIDKKGDVLLATSIMLTTLSVDSIVFRHVNHA